MKNKKQQKLLVSVDFEEYKVNCEKLKRTLVYHPSNSKIGFAIKGTNLRVSFKYT